MAKAVSYLFCLNKMLKYVVAPFQLVILLVVMFAILFWFGLTPCITPWSALENQPGWALPGIL